MSLKSSAVIGEWTEAADADTRNVLRLMNGTIADGKPVHVFALTTGEGAENVQAIATVSVERARPTNREVVFVRQAVANPTAHRFKYVAELLRSINDWAAGRFVVVSQSKDMEDYFKSVGYVPNDMGWDNIITSGYGLESLSENFRMRTLELDTAQGASVPIDTRASATGGAAATAPRVAPVTASMVIDEWATDAGRERYSAQSDYKTARIMKGTGSVLRLMSHTIAEGVPEHVFALTAGAGTIQALATVATRADPSGRGEVVDVRELVARPTAGGREHVAELLRQIHRWAAGRTVAVSLNEELEDYYRSLGYDPKDMASPDILSQASGGGGPPSGEVLHMHVLDHDVAQKAISQWTGVASKDKYTTYSDYQDARVMKSTGVALEQMSRTIAAGLPSHVFGLTTGEGAEHIQAIGTVTTQVGAGGEEVVDIRELVARPTADGRTHIAELIRSIQSWAAGRTVTISQSEDLEEYYRRLGFDTKGMLSPGAIASGSLPGQPPRAGEFRLRSLEFETARKTAASSSMHASQQTAEISSDTSSGSAQKLTTSSGKEASATQFAPMRASTVINKWTNDAGKARYSRYNDYNDYKAARIVEDTENILHLMAHTIAAGIPEHVFALMSGGGIDDIHAIATVTTKPGIGGERGTVEIREIVARPTADAPRYVAELIRNIHSWAAGRAVTVSLNRELEDYYTSLGYDPKSMASLGAAPGEPQLAASSRRETYRMRTLGLDAAQRAINEWSTYAARNRYSAYSDYKTARIMRGTEHALQAMGRSIAGGIPEYVFALTTGDRDEDIQAIATVTTQATKGGQEEVVDIHELVARPTGDAHEHTAELIRNIHSWAAGHVVRISLTSELRDYYKVLGYDPNDMVSSTIVSSRSWLSEPSGGERFHMRALKLDSDSREVHVAATAPAKQWQRPVGYVPESAKGMVGSGGLISAPAEKWTLLEDVERRRPAYVSK